jgi:hypothetical protein
MSEDPLEPDDVKTLLIFKKLFSIVSLILLFFISMLFWFSKKIRRRITNIGILYLIITEILYLISILLPYDINNPDSKLCFAESLLINFFNHARLAWCFLMTYICIMESMNKLSFENHFLLFSIIYIFILITIPFLLSLYVYLNDLSGNYGAYCYLPLNNEEMRFYIVRIHIYYTAIKFCFIVITFYCIFLQKQVSFFIEKVYLCTRFVFNT